MTEPVARGRPRSEVARRAVLDAALELCQRDGYQALTIKGIAERAGVGRQTVYRWWPTKQAVLLEALRDLALRESPRLAPDTGDALRDVHVLLAATFTFTREVTGNAVVGLMAEAQNDPELAARLQGTVTGPRRAALREVLRKGVLSGRLSDRECSLELAVDFAFGTMWYRLISRHAPVGAELAEELTTALRRLMAVPDAGG
ncbi:MULTISPECIES: TetR/AcrR family transcriptional regulator [Streptomycetaceae]|uniref:AcrR family transcriptional regulator n=1 Tax=Streptantibioticus cattleyicolor (strain ATCC 35852 / DSM 46488 / JCM 4925 / NBRC 14057 / NRRL 8057) TaxID=1003195 RepID=F8JVN8_STREN|nr:MULTISPECIES: TetR/AcrR family transcriptional regulator [Streptomycetaceae]AEW96948.1 AcrR family transcriptional regulator [Streptantibioticus cattleyicolor NRRL 8057 = DSM 46488]MYS61420.1 TetR family transcriptional regulator [Streptomyces sp. SID5468]CCB77275.1 Transcriptional regulator, TetR family [Streptantibioticus cattleyicolor NRRL 8057 = DSM 46488]